MVFDASDIPPEWGNVKHPDDFFRTPVYRDTEHLCNQAAHLRSLVRIHFRLPDGQYSSLMFLVDSGFAYVCFILNLYFPRCL